MSIRYLRTSGSGNTFADRAISIIGGAPGTVAFQSAESQTSFSSALTWTDSTNVLTLGTASTGPIITSQDTSGVAAPTLTIKSGSVAGLGQGGSIEIIAGGSTGNGSAAPAEANSGGGSISITAGGGTNATWAGPGGEVVISGGTPVESNTRSHGGGAVKLNGGRGQSTTAGGPIIFSTSPNNTLVERIRILASGALSVGPDGTNTGTTGQVLTSNGASSSPSWQDPTGGSSGGGSLDFGSFTTPAGFTLDLGSF